MPIVFAGSIERTSLAEQGEPKGFAVVELGERRRLRFVELPTRPLADWRTRAEREQHDRARQNLGT